MRISKFDELADVERQIRHAEHAGAARQLTPHDDIMRRYHDEHAWRARGELAIRQEMERRIARRRTK